MSAPRTFASPDAFRKWLARHHDRESELLVRCFKVHARHRGLTYKQALDEALCIGWIDGVRHGLDEDSFSVRFSPRRSRSLWSAVNVKRARELEAEGRMTAVGRAAFERRQSAKGVDSFESKPTDFPPALKRRFRAHAKAFTFWSALPPGYRRTVMFWVMSARQEATRERRLAELMGFCARGERLPLLSSPSSLARTKRRGGKSL